jgi:FSR family fosmidomycin resistance protein-like MFS transporter
MAMGVVLLTFLSGTILPMTNTQIGFAVSAQALAGALSQPFFGLRADRTGGRNLGGPGVAWVAAMFSLALLLAVVTHNYVLMLIPFVLQGLGSGAFHPVGALHAAESDRRRSASNMSYFFLAGQIGLAVGPTLAGLLLDVANLDALALYVRLPGLPDLTAYRATILPVLLLALLAIPPVLWLIRSIPVRQPAASATPAGSAAAPARAFPVLPFTILALMVALRALSQPGSVNFIPALFQAKGWTPAEYGFITGMFWLAAGIAGVICGYLADRYDQRAIITWTMVASAPAFYLLPVVDGVPALVLAIAAGGLSGGTHSLLVVLAQQLIPRSKGFASGAILGYIFATGALGSLIIGSISDRIGLEATFHLVAVTAVISGLMGLLLPKTAPRS